jgi:chemotaxis protein methyltransferase CheR
MAATITDQEFGLFQSLIYQQVGIKLEQQKKTLLVSRLGKRLRDLELSSYQAYYDRVNSKGGEEELTRLVDLISTNKTDFFREPVHFDFLRETVLPQVEATRALRIWSSASSSGEEPYTIAMTLCDAIPDRIRWDIKVLASDISTRVLAKAASGIYDEERVGQLPKDVVRRHFLRGKGEQTGKLKVRQALSDMIAFRRINLMAPTFPIRTPLDIIFCRNVMIYFGNSTKRPLLDDVYRLLKPGGYLIVSHTESLTGVTDQFERVGPSIYRKAEHDNC